MTRLSKVINSVSNNPIPTTDDRFITECYSCGTQQRLTESLVETEPPNTRYRCKAKCGATVLVVIDNLPPGPITGGGYRFGTWGVRNPRDVYHSVPGKIGVVNINASADPATL